MRKLFGITTVAMIALAIPFAAPAAQASGSTTTCIGTLDPGTYHRVVVPQNAVCLSDGPVRIVAGLWVQPGATFELGSDESPSPSGTISGGVHATDPAGVHIHHATINGGLRDPRRQRTVRSPVRRHLERDRGQHDPRRRDDLRLRRLLDRDSSATMSRAR